ncbi:MAG: M81 family metallopeptidase [Lachnospiraceae bacterium]|nr:M81 family metallopeptidase [Lachnospiraceae bacterium]
MRFAIGGFNHETNAFSNVPTNIESFRKYTLLNGTEILTRCKGIRGYVGGSIDEADEQGIELVPTLYCTTNRPGSSRPRPMTSSATRSSKVSKKPTRKRRSTASSWNCTALRMR